MTNYVSGRKLALFGFYFFSSEMKGSNFALNKMCAVISEFIRPETTPTHRRVRLSMALVEPYDKLDTALWLEPKYIDLDRDLTEAMQLMFKQSYVRREEICLEQRESMSLKTLKQILLSGMETAEGLDGFVKHNLKGGYCEISVEFVADSTPEKFLKHIVAHEFNNDVLQSHFCLRRRMFLAGKLRENPSQAYIRVEEVPEWLEFEHRPGEVWVNKIIL